MRESEFTCDLCGAKEKGLRDDSLPAGWTYVSIVRGRERPPQIHGIYEVCHNCNDYKITDHQTFFKKVAKAFGPSKW